MLLMARAATVGAYSAAPFARAAGAGAMRQAVQAGRPSVAQCARCFGVQCSSDVFRDELRVRRKHVPDALSHVAPIRAAHR